MSIDRIRMIGQRLGLVEGPRMRSLRPSLDAAAAWLARAQDATPDEGVSAYYDASKRQWAASYPETTGYIIPTLYEYAELTGKGEFFERATRMAHWESDIQLPGGGVRAGYMDADNVVPTIFNTGQVLFGWIAALERTGDSRFAESLRKACDWLVEAQDADGAWRQFASPYSYKSVNVYNTSTAYGLGLAGLAMDERSYRDAACANVDWAVTRMQNNGWLADNDLEDNARPLTHTIAYAARGILELGHALARPDFIECAGLTALASAGTQRRDGALPGRLDAQWKAAAKWSCLTGNAQMAIIWLRLLELSGSSSVDWHTHAYRCVAFTQAKQELDHPNPGCRGAIAGSAPRGGNYMRYRYPNWAAKFYMDALMQLARTEGLN